MLSAVSQTIVLVLGLCIIVLSGWGAVYPHKLMKLVTSALDQKWGMYLGVTVRLVLGVTLIIAAPNSLFPLVFQALGCIAIFAALALVVMGRKRTRKLIAWFEQLSMPMIRLWLVFGMAFGGLLVYGNL